MTEIIGKEIVPYEGPVDLADMPEDPFLENVSASETTDTEYRATLPPQATLLERATKRLTKFNVNRAHSRALAEQGQRNRDTQEDAFASYEGNIAATAERDEAYARNEKIDAQTARSERRAEMREQAIESVRGIGRSALNKLKETGSLSLGLTLAAGEATASKTKDVSRRTVENGKQKSSEYTDKAFDAAGRAGEAMQNGVNQGLEVVDSGVAKAKSGIDFTRDVVSSAKEALEYRKQERAKRKEAALSSKYARHAKWFNMKRNARDRAESFTDGAKSKAEAIKQKQRRVRSAGRMALQTFRDHV